MHQKTQHSGHLITEKYPNNVFSANWKLFTEPDMKIQNFYRTCSCTVQSPFSDIKFSDNLWFSDIIRISDSFCGDQKCH